MKHHRPPNERLRTVRYETCVLFYFSRTKVVASTAEVEAHPHLLLWFQARRLRRILLVRVSADILWLARFVRQFPVSVYRTRVTSPPR